MIAVKTDCFDSMHIKSWCNFSLSFHLLWSCTIDGSVCSSGALTNDAMNTKKKTILAKPDHTKNPHIHTSISGTRQIHCNPPVFYCFGKRSHKYESRWLTARVWRHLTLKDSQTDPSFFHSHTMGVADGWFQCLLVCPLKANLGPGLNTKSLLNFHFEALYDKISVTDWTLFLLLLV